jgi:hypothetical protein
MGCYHIFNQINELLFDMSEYGIVLGLFIGYMIAIVFGERVAEYLESVQDAYIKNNESNKKNNPTFPTDAWDNFVNISKSLTNPTKCLGMFETSFFYICLIINMPEGIGAWLVFKVAVKWEAWTNIVKLPEKILYKEKEVDGLEYLVARNKLATVVNQKFLIGTLGNIMAALAGMGIFSMIRYLLRPIS